MKRPKLTVEEEMHLEEKDILRNTLFHLTTDQLLAVMQYIATKRHGGYFTVLKFTADCRVGFGTPFTRDDYGKVPPFDNLILALRNAILNEPEF